jgi:hypothetical protein
MNYLVAAALIASLMGCSTGTAKEHAQYDAYLSLMKGLSVDQLMNSWGRSDETSSLKNGSKVMTYSEHREIPISQYNLFTGRNEMVRKELKCRTSFEIGPDDHVRSYKFEGNGCGAKRLRTQEQ